MRMNNRTRSSKKKCALPRSFIPWLLAKSPLSFLVRLWLCRVVAISPVFFCCIYNTLNIASLHVCALKKRGKIVKMCTQYKFVFPCVHALLRSEWAHTTFPYLMQQEQLHAVVYCYSAFSQLFFAFPYFAFMMVVHSVQVYIYFIIIIFSLAFLLAPLGLLAYYKAYMCPHVSMSCNILSIKNPRQFTNYYLSEEYFDSIWFPWYSRQIEIGIRPIISRYLPH